MFLESRRYYNLSHEEIITYRDQLLRVLQTSLQRDPDKYWQDLNIRPGTNPIFVPRQAIIETIALTTDIFLNGDSWRSNWPGLLKDHGEELRNDTSVCIYVCQLISNPSDRDGLGLRIALARGYKLCQDQLQTDELTKNEKQRIFNSLLSIREALSRIDVLSPLGKIG